MTFQCVRFCATEAIFNRYSFPIPFDPSTTMIILCTAYATSLLPWIQPSPINRPRISSLRQHHRTRATNVSHQNVTRRHRQHCRNTIQQQCPTKKYNCRTKHCCRWLFCLAHALLLSLSNVFDEVNSLAARYVFICRSEAAVAKGLKISVSISMTFF